MTGTLLLVCWKETEEGTGGGIKVYDLEKGKLQQTNVFLKATNIDT